MSTHHHSNIAMFRIRQGSTYAKRDEILAELGFASYGDYLKSDLWASIRKRVWMRYKRCATCHRRAKHIHHADYFRDTLDGSRIESLVPVCRDCHHRIEFYADGLKRSVSEASRMLQEMLADRQITDSPPPKLKPKKVQCVQCGRKFVRMPGNRQIRCGDCIELNNKRRDEIFTTERKEPKRKPKFKISALPVAGSARTAVEGQEPAGPMARPTRSPGSGPLAHVASLVLRGGCARRNQSGLASNSSPRTIRKLRRGES